MASFYNFAGSPATPLTSGSSTAPEAPQPHSNSFPGKLHHMLTEIEEKNATNNGGQLLEKFVSWAPHGRCFIIKDKDAFAAKVIPQYFYQLKYISFQRHLNLYGFKKMQKEGPDKGAYYHELFLRGKPLLAENIRRTKGRSDKLKACEEEPNFYSLPPLPSYTSPRTSEPVAPLVPMNRPEGSVFADLATSFAASRYHLQHAIQETSSSTMDPGQRVESQPSATQRQDLFTADLCQGAAHSLAHNATLVRERKRNAEKTQPSSIKPRETPSTLQRLLNNQTGVTPFALDVGHIEAKESPRHQNQCVTTTEINGIFLRQQYYCGDPVAGQEQQRQQQGDTIRPVDRRSPPPSRPFEESFLPSVSHFLKKKGFRHENQAPGQQHKEHDVKEEQSPGVCCETFCAADLEPTPLGVEARVGGQISLSSSKTNRDLYQFQEIFGAGGGIAGFTGLKPATTLSSSSPMALDHSNTAGLRQLKFAPTAYTSSLATREECDGPGLANRQTGFQRGSSIIGECIADSRASFGQL